MRWLEVATSNVEPCRLVSNQQSMEVVAIVSQQDIKQLRLGMPPYANGDCAVNEIVHGKVSRISPDPVLETPPELVGDAGLISERNVEGKFAAPIEPHYGRDHRCGESQFPID